MKHSLRYLAVILLSALITAPCAARQKKLLDNQNWLFSLEYPFDTQVTVQSVTLPHDWSITTGTYSIDAASGNDGGYVPTGLGYYETEIDIPAIDPEKRYSLIFDGVYMDAAVCVNDSLVAHQPYGYTTFYCDITDKVTPGLNKVVVKVDNNKQKNSRWYSGSGIYRHVWLLETDALHVANDGIFITTPSVGLDKAEVKADITLVNQSKENKAVEVKFTLYDGAKEVCRESKKVAMKASENADLCLTSIVEQPTLWSPNSPNLYKAVIEVVSDGKVVDTVEQTMGIRSIEFSADEGFKLNGEPMAIFGGCVHHDNGVLGAMSFDAAEARKVALMKEAGFNAVRTSHNPPSPAFLDECDKQGLLVIDEIFDGWQDSKTPHDYSNYFNDWWERDLSAMIKRDRNHPSIIIWSIGNEVIERKELRVVTTAKHLADKCRELDPTRPVTSALASWDSDWEIYDPLAAQHEITGYNYMIHKAESDHERVPSRVMLQTESFPRDAFTNWQKVNNLPYVIGDFVWTAIDYLGESGIGRNYYEGDVPGEHWERPIWPWHGALCGDIDLTGHRKPVSYYRQMLFAPESSDSIYMAVREPEGYYGKIKQTLWSTYPTWESWTWPGHEGKDIDIEVYSRYPKVRLYLDDELIGEEVVDKSTEYKATFTLPYRHGKISAVGVTTDGKESTVSPTLSTAGEPYRIRLNADRETYDTSGHDLAYVTIEVLDKNGNIVPNVPVFVECDIKGAEILATGSADMKDMLPYRYAKRLTDYGRAIAVVKMPNKKGAATLSVKSPGLKGNTIKLKTK